MACNVSNHRVNMNKATKIPKATITRISLYCRQLELIEFDGYRMVSSEKLAWLCQVNPAQVRKDLGYFGEFGVRGVGYDVRELLREIKKILSVNRNWNMGLVGIGNMGSAILHNQNFADRGFYFVAAFDNDPKKIGNRVFPGLEIKPIEELALTVINNEVEIGVIATPASEAQHIADLFLAAHVNAILNFSPTQILVPDCCLVENIDFTIKLDILTYKLKRELESGQVERPT